MDKKKKKKDHKSGSTTHQEVEEPNHLLNKEDQTQSGAKKNTSGSSSHENAQPSNQQFQPNFQWPYSTQSDVEQTPLISKPCIPSHSPSPIILGQLQNSQLNQVQHSQTAHHSAQAAMSFWLAQQPGYHLPGANGAAAYHPFTPVGTTDVTWQGANTISGDFSPGNQLQPPCYSYPAGYPYPGFSGPWNPSSWWVQQQQSIPPFTYTNPGACGYFSSPSVPGCSAASAPSSQRGIIQPPAKLSQKHQQLWEAQSAENVQLWNVVGHLQSELANYKNRLTKLEADVLSLKPTVIEPAAHGSGATLPGEKKTKRGRPKRQIASNDVNPSTDRSLPRARGRKPKLHNAQSETKELNCEKHSQKKLEDKADSQKEIDGKTLNVVTDPGDRNGISISNPIFHNQTLQDSNRVKSSSESKFDDIKVGESKTNFSITSHQVKGLETKNYATYGGMTNDGKFVWPSNISTSNCGKDLINISSQSFYNDFNFTGHARRLVGGWSFGNEDVSVSHENVAIESGSNENEQIENDGSSSAEDTA